MLKYFKEIPYAVTICDKDGNILEQNDRSIATFCKDGKSKVGDNLMACHPEPARSKLMAMLENHDVNAYTIEKNGVKKLIYQAPWFEEGEFKGYVELSMEIPFEMPHYVRQPKQ